MNFLIWLLFLILILLGVFVYFKFCGFRLIVVLGKIWLLELIFVGFLIIILVLIVVFVFILIFFFIIV